MQLKDCRGLPVTAANAEAVALYDLAVDRYCLYRADTMARVDAALALDPTFPLANALKGYLVLLSLKEANVAVARRALDAAATNAATPRERAHLAALRAWADRDVHRANAIWGGIVAEHPADVLALRVQHFNLFWLGDVATLRATVEAAAPRWSAAMPGWNTLLSMRAFGAEESGDYQAAERFGRDAVACNGADMWGVHAVSHVLEMQGRAREGIAWVNDCAAGFGDANHIIHHVWWHQSLNLLDGGDADAALALYDSHIRNLDSPLVRALPDLPSDLHNPIGLLWRLELLGLPVDDRWAELADRCEPRVTENLHLYSVSHYAMALAAGGRSEALARLRRSVLDDIAGNRTSLAPVMKESVLPVVNAIAADRAGDYGRVVTLLAPLWPSRLQPLGGSHAQRDLFTLMLLRAAAQSGDRALATRMLDQERAARPAPPERRPLLQRAAA